MVYEVDFAIKLSNTFRTIHTAIIHAITVNECKDKAEEIRDSLPQSKQHEVRIFIEA